MKKNDPKGTYVHLKRPKKPKTTQKKQKRYKRTPKLTQKDPK